MRKVFFAGTAAFAVLAVVSGAIRLLNEPSDAAVAGGYFVVLALMAVGFGFALRLGRRL